MKTARTLLLIVALLAVGSGCASGPALEKYPRAQIDRPYTLPLGVNTWHIVAPLLYARNNDDKYFFPPIPIPLVWRQSLTDNWTLLWTPAPTIQHQFYRTKTDVIGATFGYNVSYGSVNGFSAGPVLSATHRHQFSEKLALETNANYNAIYTGKTHEFRWAGSLMTGPFFQVSPLMALGPKVGIGYERAYSSYYVVTTNIRPSSNALVTLPLGAWWQFSFYRQWELTLDYNYYHIGYDNGFYSHTALISMIHSW